MVSKQFVGVNQYFHMKIWSKSFVDKTLSIFLHIKPAYDLSLKMFLKFTLQCLI